MKKNLFPQSGRALEQVPRAGPRGSLHGHIPNPLRHVPVPPALGTLPWCCWTGRSPEALPAPAIPCVLSVVQACHEGPGQPLSHTQPLSHCSAQSQHQDSELCPTLFCECLPQGWGDHLSPLSLLLPPSSSSFFLQLPLSLLEDRELEPVRARPHLKHWGTATHLLG